MTIKYGLLNDKHSWQDPVKDKDLSAPPGGEATGDRYLIATGASGDWADKAGNIGLKIEGGWSFIPPFEGMMVHVDDEDVYYKYTGSAWGIYTWGEDGNRVSLTATGTLANGDTVALNSDGTVEIIGAKPGIDDTEIFASASSTSVSSCFDSNSNKIVVVYKNSSNSGAAVVGTISGTSITFGSVGSFGSGTVDYVSCCFDSNLNKVVAVYKNSANGGSSAVGTVSGTTISFGAAVEFNSGLTLHTSCCFDSNSNKVVIFYQDGGNSYYGYSRVATVAGTSISFGTAVDVDSTSSSYISSCFDSNSNRVVMVYKDHGNSDHGTAVVGTVASTDISFGTPVKFNSTTTFRTSCCFDTNSNKVIIAYSDENNSFYGTAIVGTVITTAITFGDPVVFNSAAINYPSCCFDSVTNKVVISYTADDASDYGNVIVGTVADTAISFGNSAVYEYAATAWSSISYDTNSSRSVVAYRDEGNSNYGTSVLIETVKINSADYLGISESAVTGTAATIALQGSVVTNQTGLTIDAEYFVDDDGSLTTDNTKPYVGRALSTTSLALAESTGVNTGDNAANTSIVATKLDDFTTPDDNTDLNANTTNHGLLVKATAPAAGLHNYVGIANGETAYTNKALFDATDPTTQAFGDSAAVGSAATAARRDHKHAMMASSVYTLSFDNSDLVDGILTVSHALGVQYPHVTVYNNSHAQVIPDSISDGDELNSITVNLINYTPLTGTWNGRVSV